MPEVIVNTSPLQYLHQLGLLDLLPRLVERVTVPVPVVEELAEGRRLGYDVPDPKQYVWMDIRPLPAPAELRLAVDLGMGEASVLALALESEDPLVIIDDAMGRRLAVGLGIPLRGTLGVLLDAKRSGLVPAVAPLIKRLQGLRFHVSAGTVAAILRLAGEDADADA